MKKQINSKIVSLIFGIFVISFAIVFYTIAWEEPTVDPPGGDVDTPINVGSIGQNKEGNLTIGGNGGVGMLETMHSTFLATIDGNVGIGTTIPGAKLEVNGDVLADNFLLPDDSAGGIYTDHGYNTGAAIQLYGTVGSLGTTNEIRFLTGSTFIPITNLMVMKANGSVGIGTLDPKSTLHVAGQITIDALDYEGRGLEIAGRSSDGMGMLRFLTNDYLNWYGGIGNFFGDGNLVVSSTSGSLLLNPPEVRTAPEFDPSTFGNVGIGTKNPTSTLHVMGLLEYNDNADAIANGLTAGAFYRTGDLLKVVH